MSEATRKTIRLPKIEYTQLEKARHKISALSSRDDLQTIVVFGGREGPSQDIIEENERRQAKYWQEYFAIIEMHGVEREFLNPLNEKYTELSAQIKEVRWEIAQLEQIGRRRRQKRRTAK